jgi:glycerol-3-phosphate acyltransferase PlsY
LTPKAVLVAIGIFLAVTAAFRWVALGSIIASASLPLAASALGEVPRIATAESAAAKPIFPILLMLAGSLLIILKHHSNIRRMLAGTEPRFGIPRK